MNLVTALGRLLHDGRLRDAFAAAPEEVIEQLGLRADDRPALLAVSTAELECQAKVLLRKRFDAIAHLIPDTLSALGEKAWLAFQDYGRQYWPDGKNKELQDVTQFIRHCMEKHRKDVSNRERNKIAFISSNQRTAVYWVKDIRFRNRHYQGSQILVRRDGGRWSETVWFLGL